MKLKIINTGPGSAQANMDIDQRLLADLDEPILHLYQWQGPALTHGHFIRPGDYLNLEALQKNGIDIGKRPTGGGIIFHIWDWAFSVLVPANHPKFSVNTLDNYKLINDSLRDAVQSFLGDTQLLASDPESIPATRHFCMAKPTIYDVMLGSKKIAGSAQRRTKKGFLHQGSICVCQPDDELLSDVLLEPAVHKAMKEHTYPLAPPSELEKTRTAIQELLIKSLETHLAL